MKKLKHITDCIYSERFIEVGEYTLYQFIDVDNAHMVWIENEDGEGMTLGEKQMDEIFVRYF